METGSPPGLRRALKLRHLVLYGIVIVQPIAPMGVYGVVSNVAGGQVVTTILIGMAAMLLTAVSYGRMARVYPSAGSAYTYVAKELNPLLGYVVGWSMLMDYLLNPIICAIWCSAAAQNVLPGVPYAAWAVAFVLLFTALNLRGVRSSGRVNAILTIGMSIVLVVATQARGSVLIHQKMFESRLFFVDKLIDMGAQIILCDPHRAAVIIGSAVCLCRASHAY